MKKIILITAMALCAASASAADFFDTAQPDKFFALGVRAGVNTANATLKDEPQIWNHNSWGIGFTGGVVANINFRDWLTIQPGFFYDTRSNSYSYVFDDAGIKTVQMGHTLNYNFTIPVMAQVNFNLTGDLRWNVEAGPYVSFGLGKHDEGKILTVNADPEVFANYSQGYYDQRRKTQWGIKMGTGFLLRKHYYLGVHYLAGCTNVWKGSTGRHGKAKEWVFSVGYDF